MTLVAGVTAAASRSTSRLQRPSRPSGTGTARAPDVSIAPTKFGQAGDGINASSPAPRVRRTAISIACMPADGGEEALGPERAAARRRAVDAGHIGGDRLAQRRNSGLVGIERLAPVDRRLRRLGRDGRRRQVALADPKRDEPLPIASVVEHFDDAARGGVADGRLDFGEPVAFWGRGDGHGAASWRSRGRSARGISLPRRHRRIATWPR